MQLKFMGELWHLDEHALGAQLRTLRAGNRCEAWENGRHARAAQRGPRKIGQRYENVRRQSRELRSIPAALCDEIAAAASET